LADRRIKFTFINDKKINQYADSGIVGFYSKDLYLSPINNNSIADKEKYKIIDFTYPM
jgi:hypothetical protein